MNINKNNLFARYYEWIYGDLPNDICSFFWGSLYAIGLSPILIMGRLWLRRWDVNVGKCLGAGILFYFLYATSVIMGLLFYGQYQLDTPDGARYSLSDLYHLLHLSWYDLLFGMPLFLAGVVVGYLLLVGIPIGIIYLILKGLGATASIANHTVLVQNTKDFIGAVKRDHCTKINWK